MTAVPAGARTSKEPAQAGAAQSDQCAHAGDEVQLPGWYVVKEGDSLWEIAARFYRAGHRYRLIKRANGRRIASARRIYACQRIYLPKGRWRA